MLNYIVFQTALALLSSAIDCSGHDETTFSNVSSKPQSTSFTTPTVTFHQDIMNFTTHKPLTKTRRVSEFPKNDDNRIDSTVYVNRIEEAFIVLKRDIEAYVRTDDAGNYTLMVLKDDFKLRRLVTISELFSISRLHHQTIGLHFNQKLLLHNKFFHHFERWWMIKPCASLAPHKINKCRVISLGSNDILVNVAKRETPKALLFHNNGSISLSSKTGISDDRISCFVIKKHKSIQRSNCFGTESVRYFLLTIDSSCSLQFISTTSNLPSVITIKVLDVSQIISIDSQSSSQDDITVDLVQDKTSLLLEFMSREISIVSCSTYDGRDTRRLCELSTRNVSLPARSRTKLLSDENVIMNIGTGRSASYLITYYNWTGGRRDEKVIQVIETSDKRYMGSACFNESLVGCRRDVSYTTWLGNTSFDRMLVEKGVKAEQTIVLCNSSESPVILCTPRLMEKVDPSPAVSGEEQSVLLLSLFCCVVVLLFIGGGWCACKLRVLLLDRECDYHMYTKPDCEPPALEIDYTGIEVVHPPH